MSASIIQPQVQRMLDNEGVYITGSLGTEGMIAVMVSKGGKIYSTRLDQELAPDRFLDDLVIKSSFIFGAPK